MTTTASRFTDILDIDLTPRYDELTDGECFGELASVFWEHRMTDRFAVTLLHTHFHVGDDESLVEFVDLRTRELIIRTLNSLDANVRDGVPTSWRLTYGASMELVPIPVQLAARQSFEGFGSPGVSGADLNFMAAVASVLMKHGKLNRFGICFAKTDIRLSAGECLLETTCGSDRSLYLTPARTDLEGFDRHVQTSWRFHPPLEGFNAWGRCKKTTSSSCYSYCRTSCKWDGGEYGCHSETHKGARHKVETNSVHYES